MRRRWKEWGVVVLGAILAVRTAANVWRLHKAGERVKEARVELDEATARNQELRGRLEYVQSDEFIEKEAREKLGYGRPGEEILIMSEQGSAKSEVLSTKKKPNWRKWWELYIGI